MAVSLLALTIASSGSTRAADVYANFPITLKSYAGPKQTSVSYGGQITRHVLHDSLKKLAGSGDGTPNPALKAKMTTYFEGKDAGRAIIAPVSKGKFVIRQSTIDDLGKGTNLAGKTFKGTVSGMPNTMTGSELVRFWISKAADAKGGVDLANGYDYPQLISKFIMGAVSYNQAVDNYLDELLAGDKKPNNAPYGKGAAYTGKEHVWDEAFGYFGTPAHTLELTAKQVYGIAKQRDDAFQAADRNKDGKIDLLTEMAYGPAYYAAGFDASVYDKGNATTYLHTITRAFVEGRKLITSAGGAKLSSEQLSKLAGYANTIRSNWQKVLAEAAYKYAGSVYKDMSKLKTIVEAKGDTSKVLRNYVKHWGELKGFSLALQAGRDNLGETEARLNRLIGFGPVLLNTSQVMGIDRNGNYQREESVAWGEYMLHMAKVQKLLADKFGVKAQNNTISGDIAALAKSLGAGNTAEND